MLLTIDRFDPEHWLVAQVARTLQAGGVVVIPTDTVYGVVCDIECDAAAERIYRLKGMDSKKLLSILCSDLAMAAQYTRGIPNTLFRVVRRKLPGPYTFIMPASKELPRIMRKHRKTVGIRVPDCPFTLELIAQFQRPLLTTPMARSRRVTLGWVRTRSSRTSSTALPVVSFAWTTRRREWPPS